MENEFELIKFFKNWPKFFDYESKLLQYKIDGEIGFNLFLYRNVYESYASISLRNVNDLFIFDIGIKNVNEIKVIDSKMNINFSENGNIIVSPGPIFTVSLEMPQYGKKDLETIKCNEIDLIELFSSVPIVMDKETNVFQYQSIDLKDFIVSLFFSANENYSIVSLIYQSSNIQVLYLRINNVEKIEAINEQTNKCLKIYSKDNNEPFLINFRPNVFLQVGLNNNNE